MSNDSSDTSHRVVKTQQTTRPLPPIIDVPPPQQSVGKANWGPIAGVVYGTAVLFGSQFFAYAVALMIGQFRGMDAEQVNDWISTAISGQFVFTLIAEATIVGAILWFVRQRKDSLKTIGIDRPRLKYVWYAIGGFVLYFVGYAILFSIVSKYVPAVNVDQEQDIGFKDPIGNSQLALTFISLAILPPLAEEVLFRGFAYTGLRRKLSFLGAATFTSVLFAIGHLQLGSGAQPLWIAAVDTFALSMVLCYIREKTGSIWTGVLIHGIKNSLAFLALYTGVFSLVRF